MAIFLILLRYINRDGCHMFYYVLGINWRGGGGDREERGAGRGDGGRLTLHVERFILDQIASISQ